MSQQSSQNVHPYFSNNENGMTFQQGKSQNSSFPGGFYQYQMMWNSPNAMSGFSTEFQQQLPFGNMNVNGHMQQNLFRADLNNYESESSESNGSGEEDEIRGQFFMRNRRQAQPNGRRFTFNSPEEQSTGGLTT
jgi:hypothetical protein